MKLPSIYYLVIGNTITITSLFWVTHTINYWGLIPQIIIGVGFLIYANIKVLKE